MERAAFLQSRVCSLILVLSIVAGTAACSSPSSMGTPDPNVRQTTLQPFETEYQAVLLANNQVFFGKLEGFGSSSPILREVYYIRTVPAPEDPAKTTNVLVKRGQEWHAPDYMILNPNSIILVEPVAKDSKLAQLIAEQRAQ